MQFIPARPLTDAASVVRTPDKLPCSRDEEAPRGNSVPFEPAMSLISKDGREMKKHAFPNGQALTVLPKLLRFADLRMQG
jgi:hypothetical protein